jgi:hypothetical protein
MFGIFGKLKAVKDGDRLLKVYERALSAANKYIPIKLGPGNAKLASAMLNEILCGNVFKGNGVEELLAENAGFVRAAAQDILKADPLLRQLMAHTLWVKWGLDKAFNRNEALVCLEKGWAFQTYSSEYPLLTLPGYEMLVAAFEKQTTLELENYIKKHSEGKHEEPV